MKGWLEWMTWLVIWLVLTIPVTVAQPILTVQKFAGRDGVNNYAKEGDELTIQLLAEMLGSPTPEVARQRVRVYNDDTFTFMDTCAAQSGNVYQCVYKTTDLIYGGADEYVIRLYDADNNVINSAKRTLTIDFLGPRMVTFSLNPNMSTSAQPTTITYKAEDYGTETGKLTNCAGIKHINITANNAPLALISADIGVCTKEGTYTFTPTVTGQSARVTVCAVATDHLNHKSLPVCRDILIDSRKPTAEALELRDSNGFLITHARSAQPFTADIFVKIPDADVDPATVHADLSKLNPSIGKLPRSDQSGDWFIWRNIQVTSPSTCQVTAEATDFLGNKDTKTLTCTIGIDDTAPVATAISTQFVDDDGVPILGVNGTIVVTFAEEGSGFDKANAFMDLRTLGVGAEVKANKCDKTGPKTWKCSWNVRPTVASGTYTVKVLPITRDDLNNQMDRTFEGKVRFDNTAPSGVRLKEIAAFRGQQRVRTNVTSLGETLEFVVEGTGFKTVVADFTSLGGGKNTSSESCTGNLTKSCTFAFTTSVSGPQPTNITFDFTDVAGNKASFSTTELFILGISNETAPNYWNITPSCSPTLLDRATLSVFEHPVYCRLRMSTTNPQAFPITVHGPLDVTECSGQTDYISELRVENNYAGSTEPYLVMTLVATEYTINNLTFTCPMSTLTRVGNFMPQNAEKDNATVTLQFYNLPLGDLYGNIDDEIKDVQDKIENTWGVIGDLQKLMSYAEKLCQLLNTIITIIGTLSIVLLALGITASVAEAIDLGVGNAAAAQLEASRQGLCQPTDTTYVIYNNDLLMTFKKFCDFLTCQAGLFDILNGVGIISDETLKNIKTGGYSQFIMDWITIRGALGTKEAIKQALPSGTLYPPGAYLNVKDSLIFSIVIPPLCIPGIIYNLDKWRQIECRYGLCLLQDVRQGGMPVSVCKDQKHYMQCRFVVGEIFNIIPFAPVVNYYLNILQQALSDPLVLASIGIAYILNCKAACGARYGFAYHACNAFAIIAQIGQSIDRVKNMKSLADFGSISNTWCEQFEDALNEFKK